MVESFAEMLWQIPEVLKILQEVTGSLLLLPSALQLFVDFGFLRQIILVLDFVSMFFQGKVAGLTPNPQPVGPVPRIYIPPGAE
jgi:hypothetical protein